MTCETVRYQVRVTGVLLAEPIEYTVQVLGGAEHVLLTDATGQVSLDHPQFDVGLEALSAGSAMLQVTLNGFREDQFEVTVVEE